LVQQPLLSVFVHTCLKFFLQGATIFFGQLCLICASADVPSMTLAITSGVAAASAMPIAARRILRPNEEGIAMSMFAMVVLPVDAGIDREPAKTKIRAGTDVQITRRRLNIRLTCNS
jgi:hypothetical protein